MKIEHIETLLSVAKHLSFSKTANELFISQSAVSQQIRKIEEELGVELFVRDHHHVELTPAGEEFVQGAAKLIQIYKNTVDKCRCQVSGETISIGYTSLANYHILSEIISNYYRVTKSATIVRPQRLQAENVKALLNSGEVRIYLGPEDQMPDNPNIIFLNYKEEHHYCVMRTDDSLAQYSEIEDWMLNGRQIMQTAPNFTRESIHKIFSRLAKTAPDTILLPSMVGSDITIVNLLSGNYIAILAGYSVPYHPQITARPLKDDITFKYGIICQKNLSPAEYRFVNTVTESHAF